MNQKQMGASPALCGRTGPLSYFATGKNKGARNGRNKCTKVINDNQGY